MPARTAAADRCVPGGFVFGFRRFPQSKIARVFFFVFVRVDAFAAAGDVARKVDLRKLAVFGKRSDAVIDRAVGLIGVACSSSFSINVDHFRNVMRRARRNFRPLATERIEIFPERVDILRGVFVDRLCRLFCAFVMMRSSTSVRFMTCVTRSP